MNKLISVILGIILSIILVWSLIPSGTQVITPMQMYVIMCMDNIKDFLSCGVVFISALVVAACAFLFALMCAADAATESNEESRKHMFEVKDMLMKVKTFAIGVAIVTAFTTSAASLLPNTKQLITIIAVPAILNSENVQSIPKRLYKIGDAYINDMMEEAGIAIEGTGETLTGLVDETTKVVRSTGDAVNKVGNAATDVAKKVGDVVDDAGGHVNKALEEVEAQVGE